MAKKAKEKDPDRSLFLKALEQLPASAFKHVIADAQVAARVQSLNHEQDERTRESCVAVDLAAKAWILGAQ